MWGVYKRKNNSLRSFCVNVVAGISIWFLGIDSWAPQTFPNTGSGYIG